MTLHLVQAVRTRSGPGTDAEGLRLATYVVEAYLAEAAPDPAQSACTRRAVRIADVMEEPAAPTQHPVQLAVKLTAVQIAGQLDDRGVVEHGVEGAVVERGDLLANVTAASLDGGRVEQLRRPRVAASDDVHGWIPLDGDDAGASIRCLDGGVTQAGSGVEEAGDRLPMLWRSVLVKRMAVTGFIIADHWERFGDFQKDVAPRVMNDEIAWREDIAEGLENAPQTFIEMLKGGNTGKQVMKVI